MTATRKTATYVRDLEGFAGTAKLYRVEPPATWGTWSEPDENSTDYLVVSAAVVPYSGPETYIFPGNEAGEVVSWGELDGSYRGGLDHDAALTGAGYEVQP